jgi:hypothetical protein
MLAGAWQLACKGAAPASPPGQHRLVAVGLLVAHLHWQQHLATHRHALADVVGSAAHHVLRHLSRQLLRQLWLLQVLVTNELLHVLQAEGQWSSGK